MDESRYNVFACWIFQGGEREELIKKYTQDICIANWNIEKIKKFVIDNNIGIIHWHSISQTSWTEFEKSVELLLFFKKNNIKIIETSPFSLYNNKIDILLDVKLFVSKTNVLKYFWKFWSLIKDKSKYSFLYNPLDIEELEKYKMNHNEKKELRARYGIWEDDFVLGKVGRSNLWKWDDTIIDIVPKLVKYIPRLKVVIRSIPKEKKRKISRLWISNYFLCLPESVEEKEISQTYQLMDVMVHTSRIWECNSVAINEWLFFWIPIITKSTDFLQKTIFDRDNGQIEIIENGVTWYYSNNNTTLIWKIILLYTQKDVYNKISVECMNKSRKLFDARVITKELEKIFEKQKGFSFLYNEEMDLYHQRVDKNSKLDLIFINIWALIDKFIFKA